MNDTNETPEGGVVQRIKESPRTVSALIIILIVAAAIYAFSDRNVPPADVDTETEPAATEEQASPEGQPRDENGAATPTPTGTGTSAPRGQQPLPEASRTNEGFVEVAQTGEGITHLARRAADRWLRDNQAGYTVTAEHRVYIEDYIQNRVGAERLALGETRTVRYDLVAEAVAAARNLNDAQLRNLSRYTP
jgi:glucose/arabinose dehydrogenase